MLLEKGQDPRAQAEDSNSYTLSTPCDCSGILAAQFLDKLCKLSPKLWAQVPIWGVLDPQPGYLTTAYTSVYPLTASLEVQRAITINIGNLLVLWSLWIVSFNNRVESASFFRSESAKALSKGMVMHFCTHHGQVKRVAAALWKRPSGQP